MEYKTLSEIRIRIAKIRDDLRYHVNLDTDYAINLQSELTDLEIKEGLLEEKENIEKKKVKLITALEKEREEFNVRHHDTNNHDIALNWLKHGLLPSQDVDQFELLNACINDFDTICKDYE